MALGDLLSLLAMPQAQGISTMSGYNPQTPAQPSQPLLATPSPAPAPAASPPQGALMPDGPDTIAGHHVNNLLQVTGNLAPPPGVSTGADQTQANIPGGYQAPAPANDPTGGDPHYYEEHVNGPFKTHGVLGSILGHVMDAALVSAGLNPEYTKRLAYAKQQDAIQGFQQDPTGALVRLAGVAGLPEAQAFQQSTDADAAAHNAAQTQQAQLQAINALSKERQLRAFALGRQQQGNVAGQALDLDPNNPADQAKAKILAQQIRSMRAQYGDTEEVPDDIEGLQGLAQDTITPQQRTVAQNTVDYHNAVIADRQTGRAIQQQRANIAASAAASADAYRKYKMSHPNSSNDPVLHNLRIRALQGQIALQQQHGAINSMMNGVPNTMDDIDDDDDNDVSGGVPTPAPTGGNYPPPDKTIGGQGYWKYGGKWHNAPPK